MKMDRGRARVGRVFSTSYSTGWTIGIRTEELGGKLSLIDRELVLRTCSSDNAIIVDSTGYTGEDYALRARKRN